MLRKSSLVRPATPTRPDAAEARRPARRIVVLVAISLAALVAAGGALVAARMAGGGEAAPETGTTLEFGAPLGGPEERQGPWLRLRVAPAKPGENATVSSLTDPEAAPLPDAEALPVRIAAAPLDDPTAERVVTTEAEGDGGDPVDLPLDGEGWWRVTVTPERPEGGEPLRAYLLLPDPNLYGSEAAAPPASDPAAEAVFARGLAATSALHRVRYRELMADGLGHLADSTHAFNDGADGQPPASSFRATNGDETVLVGDRRWLSEENGAWRELPGGRVVPPTEWSEGYDRATGFRLGGIETVDGEPCRIVTFAVPEQTEPRREAAAWYAWWVGEESGQVRRETMVSRFHYMIRESTDFDAPLPIGPPVAASATPAGTPSP